MPERFNSNVYNPLTAALMKNAFEIAWLKCRPSRVDEAMTRTLLASAIIDQVDAGEITRDRIVAGALATLAVARNRAAGVVAPRPLLDRFCKRPNSQSELGMPLQPKRWKRRERYYSEQQQAQQRTITLGLSGIIVGLVIALIALWATRELYPDAFARMMHLMTR
jgi:hypothetical protein